MERVRRKPKIIPVSTEMYSTHANCSCCNRHTMLVAVNGVHDWVLECPSALGDQRFGAVRKLKLSKAIHISQIVVEVAHEYDRLIFWMKDDDAYRIAVKALEHGHKLFGLESYGLVQ